MALNFSYGLNNGLIKDLRMSVASSEEVQPAFELALADLKQRYAARIDNPPVPGP